VTQGTQGTKVVWAPLAGSQALALSCPAHHILYEGSRGPGKTDAQLMAFRKLVGVGYGAYWRGIIFDREYKNLDDLINKSLRWFPAFRDGARFLRSKGDNKWIWPTGEELLFRQLKRKEDYWNFHGHEFAFIGWNELCKFPNSDLYDMMMSCNRTSFMPSLHSPDVTKPLPNIPLVVFSTANPYGPGHAWVKKKFVDSAPPGVMVKTVTDVFDPQQQKVRPVTKTQVRLFGSYKENKYLTPEYVAELEKVKDPNKRKAWLEGDWNIVAGGAFDDLWNENIHVVPRFQVPSSWVLDRSFDWGSTKPFSVGFWAKASGEEARLPNGLFFCPPKGSLIRFHEFYGHVPTETNVGLNMSARQIALRIKAIQESLLADKWILRGVQPGPADNSIFNDERADVDSIAKDMEKEGITWERSNKNPNSRKLGLQLTRDRFENALTAEAEGIYFMDHCRQAIAQIPTLPRDPDDLDDVDTEAEDHLYDELRYRVLKGAGSSAHKIDVRFPR
jgi:hypothetical protein